MIRVVEGVVVEGHVAVVGIVAAAVAVTTHKFPPIIRSACSLFGSEATRRIRRLPERLSPLEFHHEESKKDEIHEVLIISNPLVSYLTL